MSLTNLTNAATPTLTDQVLAKSSSNGLNRYAALPKNTHLNVDGRVFSIPPVAAPLILDLLKTMSEGHGVAVLSVETELTVPEAAEVLGSSESFVIGLLDAGELAGRQVGNRRLIMLNDLLAYEKERKRLRKEALGEMIRESQELGLYE